MTIRLSCEPCNFVFSLLFTNNLSGKIEGSGPSFSTLKKQDDR